MHHLRSTLLAPLFLLTLAACDGNASLTDITAPAGVATTVSMDFSAQDNFYAAPFPTDARLKAEGGVELTDFPNPGDNDLAKRVLKILTNDARGFGTTSAIYFKLSGPIDEKALPDLMGSLATTSPVVLLSVDPEAPDYLQRYPVSARFFADAGPYGTQNLLALLPLQGMPLRPGTRYAAVVRRSLRPTHGNTLGVSPQMAAIAAGKIPAGMSKVAAVTYQAALAALANAHIDLGEVAGLAAFTTDTPTDALTQVAAAMTASVPVPSQAFTRTELFDTYCVYETTLAMPAYQQGTPPYTSDGGGWAFDSAGQPVLQHMEEASFVVTIPRAPMPPQGYPIAVLSRTGAGGDRPLVDRGTRGKPGGPSLVPGTGPAVHFAAAGFAGSQIDGPLGGLRNLTHGDEQFMLFNVGNPIALRDNVRQSAAELALQAHILGHVTVNVSDCPGAEAPKGMAFFDSNTMALMGHSMGATIAPLALAIEPRFRAGLLSGAGGSWIENVIYKQKPIATKGLAEVLIGMKGSDVELSEHDPLLSLFQWAGEPADPTVYARAIVHEPTVGEPRNILMMQGIVDHYILPPIANTLSLALGLDLAGPERDKGVAELEAFTPLGGLLELVGGKKTDLPVASNAGKVVTAVVTQHLADGIEDGHEVVFQTEAPKHQMRCFLQGLVKGTPRVPSAGTSMTPCE